MLKYWKVSKVPKDGASGSMEKLGVSPSVEKLEELGSWEIVDNSHQELLERVMAGDFRSNFYGSQCSLLQRHLPDAETSILIKESDVDHAASGPSIVPQPLLEELRRLIESGRTLIKDCEDETCKKAYLRLGERIEAFAETLKEMLWCSSLVWYYKKRSLGHENSVVKMDDFPQPALGEKELYLLCKAASDDLNKLHTTLDLWWKNHSCSAEECGVYGKASCLAAQIGGMRKQNYSAGDRTSLITVEHKDGLQTIDFIGHGGCGKVFKVKWLGDHYAMKELQSIAVPLKNEVTAMAGLRHPHIVRPFACSRLDSRSTFFFLMELMPSDLDKYLKDEQLPSFSLSAGIDLMLQISEAMRFIHDKGMIHGDLKPANILLRLLDDPKCPRRGFVFAKVADCGLASVKKEVISHAELTRRLSSGALGWMAPEVLSEYESDPKGLRVHYTRKADVYSFGIICFQILTKTPKVHDIYDSSKLYKELTNDKALRPKIPQECPHALSSLICECWQTNPRERPTFKEISKKLRHFKGLLLLSVPLKDIEKQTPEEAPFRSDMVVSQGPFGVTHYTRALDYYTQGTGVRAIKVFTRPHKVRPYESNVHRGFQVIGFRVQYDQNGRPMEALHGSDKHIPTSTIPNWIHFDYPGEYLIKVSGWTTLMRDAYHKDYPGPFVTSLTFFTNRRICGPYGTRDDDSEDFSTASGKVVGFFGWSGSLLHSIGVLMAPDQIPLKDIEKQTPEEAPFRSDMVVSQGPFGVTHYTRTLDYYTQGTGVRAIKVFTRPHKVRPYESNVHRGIQVIGFRVQYDQNGRFMEALHGSDKLIPTSTIPNWIYFDYPGEYLIKVSGWTTLMPDAYHKDYPGPFVTSLTFVTNRRICGPYGTRDSDSEEFSTSSGKVVGFFGWSGSLLHSIGVLMAPDQSNITSD